MSARRERWRVILSTAVAFAATTILAPLNVGAQVPRIHDSLSVDSIRFDQAPLPGGAASVFRFLFSTVPQWIQISGFFVGIVVASVVLWFSWSRRRQAWAWVTTRSLGVRIALGAALFAATTASAATGAWTWNYMMHENDFCSSCHVMKGAFSRFGVSEHQKLECHACHRQSIFASSKELYYWVLDRPEKIPPHAPVPNRICAECHVQQTADSTWKRISATAGHRVHFSSDSLSLKGLQCVDCHAREIHAFKAVDLSCTTGGCHATTTVKLGGMANQTGLHCITCHDFGRPVSDLVAIDSSSRRALVPARQECTSCHTMSTMLADQELDKDPHKATCGTCHNPHEQDVSVGAYGSCATAGCHASPDTLTVFHRGLPTHTLDQCGSCHRPHSWKPKGTTCLECHQDIFRRAPQAVRRTSSTPPELLEQRRVGGPSAEMSTEPAAPLHAGLIAAVPEDTLFDHNRHKSVACTSCHTNARTHGALTVTRPADCQECHHAADNRAGECAACHTSAELAGTRRISTTFQISGRTHQPVRDLPFDHPRHTALTCESCHTAGQERGVGRSCASCHVNHHRADATCSTCHGDARSVHDRTAHAPCASCHTQEGASRFPPSRAVCLACHTAQQNHKPNGDCAACHRTSWQVVSR